jgi:antitoxin MazE
MQLAKWGNSLAVRIPAKLVEQLGLKEGDEIEFRLMPNGVAEIARKPDAAASAFEALRKFRGRMPADFKFDRDDANSRGPDDAQ